MFSRIVVLVMICMLAGCSFGRSGWHKKSVRNSFVHEVIECNLKKKEFSLVNKTELKKFLKGKDTGVVTMKFVKQEALKELGISFGRIFNLKKEYFPRVKVETLKLRRRTLDDKVVFRFDKSGEMKTWRNCQIGDARWFYMNKDLEYSFTK